VAPALSRFSTGQLCVRSMAGRVGLAAPCCAPDGCRHQRAAAVSRGVRSPRVSSSTWSPRRPGSVMTETEDDLGALMQARRSRHLAGFVASPWRGFFSSARLGCLRLGFVVVSSESRASASQVLRRGPRRDARVARWPPILGPQVPVKGRAIRPTRGALDERRRPPTASAGADQRRSRAPAWVFRCMPPRWSFRWRDVGAQGIGRLPHLLPCLRAASSPRSDVVVAAPPDQCQFARFSDAASCL